MTERDRFTAESNFIEKRSEERFDVPDRFRRYMKLTVTAGNSRHIPAQLANFSRNGILFKSEAPLQTGSRVHCRLSLSLLIVRDIAFTVQVKYCIRNDSFYVIGASIDAITDENWFSVFEEIHDFILLRRG